MLVLLKAFQAADKNGNGFIEMDELEICLKQMNEYNSAFKLAKVFEGIDKKLPPTFDFSAWCVFMTSKGTVMQAIEENNKLIAGGHPFVIGSGGTNKQPK